MNQKGHDSGKGMLTAYVHKSPGASEWIFWPQVLGSRSEECLWVSVPSQLTSAALTAQSSSVSEGFSNSTSSLNAEAPAAKT